MLWTFLSIVVAFAELVAFMSADWLIGKAKTRGAEPAGTDSGALLPGHPLHAHAGHAASPRDTLWDLRQELRGHRQRLLAGYCYFPGRGIFILCVVALVSVFTMCVQSIMKKSIFNVCGLLQGIAGLFLILGLILYPAGWGCQKAIDCGRYASPYKPGDCSPGWAFYTATGGTVLTFICAVLSAQAEIATSSDKVQEEIEEGKNLVCLL
ncbi:hypothetical protein STEG23_001985 [Scotinomys teguina]